MPTPDVILFTYLILINIFAFLAFGADKLRAKKRLWRIPEAVLIVLSLFGGSAGALMGMLFFRHKTRHAKFIITIPLLFVIQIIILHFMLI